MMDWSPPECVIGGTIGGVSRGGCRASVHGFGVSAGLLKAPDVVLMTARAIPGRASRLGGRFRAGKSVSQVNVLKCRLFVLYLPFIFIFCMFVYRTCPIHRRLASEILLGVAFCGIRMRT